MSAIERPISIPISIDIYKLFWDGFVFICIYHLVFYDQSDDTVEYIWGHIGGGLRPKINVVCDPRRYIYRNLVYLKNQKGLKGMLFEKPKRLERDVTFKQLKPGALSTRSMVKLMCWSTCTSASNPHRRVHLCLDCGEDVGGHLALLAVGMHAQPGALVIGRQGLTIIP